MMTARAPVAEPDGRPYHHGDLRRALLRAAAEEIEREGTAALSLRALARAAGVSHAAPTHHFGDKRGLLTALAAQGHRLLAAQMREAAAEGGFLEAGVAYVRFAVTHPAHFTVMFRPDLLRRDDPELAAAGAQTREVLHRGSAAASAAPASGPPTDSSSTGNGPADGPAALAAWSLVHGLATLHSTGNLSPGLGLADLEALTRSAAAQLYGRT